MSILRQEYQKNKEEKEKVVTEAAVSWIDSNVIVINEKINRSSVNRLVSSIAKFEETFAPFKQRIPTISSIVDGCEENLQMVLTGKAGDKKTSEVLEYLSFVYNLFSSFFSKDLPVVLKARMFREAQENPAVRLDSLTGNFNIDAVAKTFAHAIEPSPEEMKLIGRVLKSKSIPKVDSKQIASELMALSYNDLVELTSMSKVPLVTTPKSLDQEDVVVSEAMLHESVMLMEASIEDIGNKINMLKQVVAQTGIEAFAGPINKLHSEILAFLGSSAGEQLQQSLKANVGKDGTSVADLFKSKGGILVKQANMAIELFNALGQAWPKVKSAIDLKNPSQQDINSIKGILVKAASSNVFKKAAQFAGIATKPYPGLEPETIVNALTESKKSARPILKEEDLIGDMTKNSSPNTKWIGPDSRDIAKSGQDNMKASVEKINKAMTALNQFATKSSAVQSSPTEPTTGSQPQGQQNQPSGGTTGAASTAAPTEKGLNTKTGTNVETPGQANSVVNAAMVALGLTKEDDKKTIKGIVTAIQKAGYTITKN